MSGEDIYQPRVMPQAAPSMPLASPADFGAGVGDAIGQLGETAHGAQIRAYQIQRKLTADREATDFAHAFALHRQAMDDVVRQLRTDPTSPDYGDHVKRVQEADQAGRDTMLADITEDSVKRQAQEQLDAYGTQLHNSEGDFAEAQRVAKTVIDRKAANDVSQNRIRTGVDPQAYGMELRLNHDQIFGLGGVTPVQKEQLWQDYQQGAGAAFLNHTIDTNPRAAKGLIDSGAFNDVLTPPQIDALRNGADVEIRRVDAQAEHAAAVVKAQVTEQIQTVKAKAAQGIDVSTELPPLIQSAQSLGDTSNVVELQGLARDSAFAKVWGGQTPLAREARISQLQRIIAERGSASQDPYKEFPLVQPTPGDRATWDKRADGSEKQDGFLGLRRRPDGRVSSEISVGLEINGQEMDVPTMVPGLTPAEVHFLMTTPVADIAKKLPVGIRDKAIANAQQRIAQGLSPFKQAGEPSYTPPGAETSDQQAELHWQLGPGRELNNQFNGDRVGYVIAHGQPNEQPPALNPADPASFAARAQWQRTAARTYGQMDLLSKQEREAMASQLTKDDNGYGEVTAALAQFGGMAAKQAAVEVAPSDHALQQLVLLPEPYRKIARDGSQWLRANPSLIPAERSDKADPGVVAYSRGFERALQAVPQADRDGIRTVAQNIAAKFLHDQGGELDEALWAKSLNMALGAAGPGGKGGLGSWNNMKFLVPDGMTAQQFADHVFGYVRAHPENGPVNPDGSSASLRNARPVAIGGGRYQFMVGDRAVMARGRDGKIASPWQFMVGGNR